MPGRTSKVRTLSKLATVVAGVAVVAVVAAACAPASSPANVRIQLEGATLATQVVDQVNDVGRSPSVGLDKDGNPAVAYLLVAPVLKKGQIAQGIIANTPQPPSVVLASEASGIWSRDGVTPNIQGPGSKPNRGSAIEIADSKNHYLPGVTVAMAVDGAGLHHVVWSTPSGLFYAVDQSVQSGSQKVLVFPSTPTQITKTRAFGASIAVDGSGTPWIAFTAWNTVPPYGPSTIPGTDVATLKGTKWSVHTIGKAIDCALCRTAITVGPDGSPWVAYDDVHGLEFAVPAGNPIGVSPGSAGTAWATERVSSGAEADGLSIDWSASTQEPVLAYYIQGHVQGSVEVSVRQGAGSWAAPQTLGSGGTPPAASSPEAEAWTTGLGVDDNGNATVAWSNTSKNVVMEARGSLSGGWKPAVAVPQSYGGWSPSLAVSPDGRHFAIAWYDSLNKHLNVAVPISQASALAVPSPSFSPKPTPATTSAPPCLPTASTSFKIVAKNIQFDLNCLAVIPNTPSTVVFDNQDAGTPHNFDIYKDAGYTQHVAGAKGTADFITGVATATYQIQALPTGIYYFKCDFHTAMTGTFVVVPKK